MRLFLISFLLLFTFAGHQALQAAAIPPRSEDRLIITKKKTVIVRSGKLARDFPERKTAVINYPEVRGLSNPAVLKKVRSTLRLKNIFDTSLAEYRQDTWLDEFDYQVNYNKNYILDITFTQSGSAAYPDTHTRHFAINLKTGETIKAADAFNASSFTRLARMADEKLQAEIKTILKEAERDASEEDRKNNVDLFAPLKFTTKNLDEFSVGDRGITFLYDAGFPHVVQALQPEGRYFFSYAELKPFIKRNGVLAQFIR